MKVRAELNYLRISPRKVRLVSGLIRGMPVKDAEAELRFLPKRASLPLLKLLKSAVANAEYNFNLERRGLVISEIRVDQGPVLKRFRARAFGRAAQILKRTSHVTLVLESGEEPAKRKTAQAAKVSEAAQSAKAPQDAQVVAETAASENAQEHEATERVEKRSIREAMKKERGGLRQKTKGFVQRMFRRKAI
jgi:large subunit ribosomal protein L22